MWPMWKGGDLHLYLGINLFKSGILKEFISKYFVDRTDNSSLPLDSVKSKLHLEFHDFYDHGLVYSLSTSDIESVLTGKWSV